MWGIIFFWPLLLAGLKALVPVAISTIGGALVQSTAQRIVSGPVLPELVEEEEDFLAEEEDEDEEEEEEEEEFVSPRVFEAQRQAAAGIRGGYGLTERERD